MKGISIDSLPDLSPGRREQAKRGKQRTARRKNERVYPYKDSEATVREACTLEGLEGKDYLACKNKMAHGETSLEKAIAWTRSRGPYRGGGIKSKDNKLGKFV